METPQVIGFTKMMSDNARIHLYLFRDADTGLITTGLLEFRADNGTVWGPLTEVHPVD